MTSIMGLTDEQADWLKDVRRDWYARMEPFKIPGGSHLFRSYPEIPQHLLEKTELFTNRHIGAKKYLRGGIGAEVGTQAGNFAKFLIENTLPAKLFLFDIADVELRKRNPTLLLRDDVSVILGDSATSLSTFPDSYFDWLYIDADHSYEGVSRDLEQAVRTVKPRGLIVLNDYNSWSCLECMPYGVVQCVNEFLNRESWPVAYFTFGRLMYCDIAIRRPEPAAELQ